MLYIQNIMSRLCIQKRIIFFHKASWLILHDLFYILLILDMHMPGLEFRKASVLYPCHDNRDVESPSHQASNWFVNFMEIQNGTLYNQQNNMRCIRYDITFTWYILIKLWLLSLENQIKQFLAGNLPLNLLQLKSKFDLNREI